MYELRMADHIFFRIRARLVLIGLLSVHPTSAWVYFSLQTISHQIISISPKLIQYIGHITFAITLIAVSITNADTTRLFHTLRARTVY